jgi:hypothetical protein
LEARHFSRGIRGFENAVGAHRQRLIRAEVKGALFVFGIEADPQRQIRWRSDFVCIAIRTQVTGIQEAARFGTVEQDAKAGGELKATGLAFAEQNARFILKTAVRTEFEVKPKQDAAAWLPALSRISALPCRGSPETARKLLISGGAKFSGPLGLRVRDGSRVPQLCVVRTVFRVLLVWLRAAERPGPPMPDRV